MTPAEKHITSLYGGYFNRCPDREGHAYWLSRFNAGMPLVDIAQSFFVQPEAVAIYGGLARGPLIDMIYANLFRRPPDGPGRQYWLTNGQPVGRMIVDIISGAQGGDMHLLNILADAADAWMRSYPNPFDIAAARSALASVLNWHTPAGANVTIISPELLPYENILIPAIKSAWLQWGIEGSIEIELGYMPLPGMDWLAMASPCMETSMGESGVEYEVQTGLDPNGILSDGRIWITWPDIAEMLGRFNLESLFAHEIGHFFFRHSASPNSYTQLITYEGATPHLTGLNILTAHYVPIPLQVDGNNRPLPHVMDDGMIMYPYIGNGRVTDADKAVLRDMGVPAI